MMKRSEAWFPLRHHVPPYYGATMQCKSYDISISLSGFNGCMSTDALLTDEE